MITLPHRRLGFIALLAFVGASLRCLPAVDSPANRPGKWEAEIAAFESANRTNPPPKHAILFIGSSSIRLWKTLAQDFPGHNVINRGFGGSEIADSVQFAERIVIPCEPRLIVLYAGGNDIHGGKTPGQVFLDFKAFVAKIRAKLPRTRIAYISIAPNPARWAEVEHVRAVNKLIADYAGKNRRRLDFINVFPHMLGPDGLPRPELFVEDRLHMNPSGYKLWTGLVGPHLGRADGPPRVLAR